MELQKNIGISILAALFFTTTANACSFIKSINSVGETEYVCAGAHQDGSPCTKTVSSNADCDQKESNVPCYKCE